jgi:hypothetical protein
MIDNPVLAVFIALVALATFYILKLWILPKFGIKT